MKLNNKGFSLVELMVVVAIIGILASVAVPSINKYMAKSRQSEAKTNLGSLYTAEKAFAAEYVLYHTAFQAIGYAPEGRMRYNIGFGGQAAIPNVAGPAQGYTQPGTVNPALFNTGAYCGAAGNIVNGCTVLSGADGQAAPAVNAAATTLAGPTFIARGIAVLAGTAQDEWQINEQKILDNTINGIL
jgi:type IV pilus assembly protein PilA